MSLVDKMARWKELREKDLGGYLSDEEWKEKDRLDDQIRAARLGSVPVPTCCPEALQYQSVYVEAQGDKAVWKSSRIEIHHHRVRRDTDRYDRFPEAKHCVYCGGALPRLVKKEVVPEPIRVADDDLCYCLTCKERLQECTCLPAEAGFEAVSG
ncbi:MAG: hypothetical protein BWY99_01375 [Synergistetes bacterium ADurb.BinA166]|nr:MAG: hypothetical protein BWY99_01375 [Synergistetes bacterium ADurb.BinA166]